MRERIAGVAVGIVVVAGTVACGGSSVGRAHDVLDRAEDTIPEIRELYEEATAALRENSERLEAGCPTRHEALDPPAEFRSREAIDAWQQGGRLSRDCRNAVRQFGRIVSDSENDVRRYDIETVTATIERLRRQLDETPADALDQMVEQNPLDDALWRALYVLSSVEALMEVARRGPSIIPTISIETAHERIAARSAEAEAANATAEQVNETWTTFAAEALTVVRQ